MENKHPESHIDFLFDVLKRYDHYIATTNVKAGLLLSFLGVVIFGVILRLSFVKLNNDCSSVILLAVSALLLITCIYCCWKLIDVVLPNLTSSKDNESLIFFGDVANMKSKSIYVNKIKTSIESDLQKNLAEQVYFVAKVTDQKFKVLAEASKIIKYATLPLLVVFVFAYSISWFTGCS